MQKSKRIKHIKRICELKYKKEEKYKLNSYIKEKRLEITSLPLIRRVQLKSQKGAWHRLLTRKTPIPSHRHYH